MVVSGRNEAIGENFSGGIVLKTQSRSGTAPSEAVVRPAIE